MIFAFLGGAAHAQGVPDPAAPPPPPVDVPEPATEPDAASDPVVAPVAPEPAAIPEAAPAAPSSQTFPGLMNPSMSFNGLFLGSGEWDDGALAPPQLEESGASAFPGAGETYGSSLAIHEMELQIQSNVDPYFKANVVLSIPTLSSLEVEEAWVQLVTIPRVQLTIGKIKQPFGRENLAHTHALLTIDKSLVGQRVLGGEGLNDVAVQGALLLPTPWFSELSVGVDRGTNEVLYGSGLPEGLGTMAHFRNLADLTYSTSIELGLSGATGLDAFDGRSVAGGVDLTLKGRGRGRHQFNRVIWQSEYLVMDRGGAPQDARLGGLYSTLEYSPSRRFWVGARFDAVGLPEPEAGGRSFAGTAIGVFAPTEFSALRLQAQHQAVPGGHSVDSVASQLIFTVGAHPAHSY